MDARQVVAGAAGVVALAAVIVASAAPAHPADLTGPDRPRAVRVDRVVAAPESRQVRAYGVTRATDRGAVAFLSGGRLLTRPVDVGARVRRGDVLATLDAEPLRHAVDAADASVVDLEARLEQAGRDRARLEALAATASASPADLERVRTQEASLAAGLSTARAQQAEARRMRREAALVAPFDGVVTAVRAEPGETVGAGQPVVELAGEGAVEVEVEVPESVWLTLDRSAATVTLPGPDCARPAPISAVAAAGTRGGLFPVVVSVDPACAPVAGMSAVVDLVAHSAPALAVPVRSVTDPSGASAAVFRVRAGAVERVPVEVDRLVGDRVAVRGALTIDDQIVIAGLVGLADGAVVEVVR